MINRRSRTSIITPIEDEDIISESRNIITNCRSITSDVQENITTSPSNQKHSANMTSSTPIGNYIFIWLHLTTNDSDENMDDSINKIRHMVDSIQIFQDSDECIDILTEIKYEQVFMIISGSEIQPIVCLIEDIPNLRSIYILDSLSRNDEQWSQEHKKVKGIFTQIDDHICNTLKKDIYALIVDLTPISIIPITSTNLDELDQTFMYTQLLKEIILKIEYDENARKEFADFCRLDYPNNEKVCDKIIAFDRDYKDHSAIWWYTTECFVYSKLNQALRLQDIETIIKMGFFLRDLHEEIQRKYLEAHQSSKLTVYRGQCMSIVDFEKLKKNEGGLLSFNSFLSTSFDRNISSVFAYSAKDNPNLNTMGILFQMEIDPSVSVAPYTDIHGESHFEGEQEILFSMHTIFRINKIDKLVDRLWQVTLTLTDDNDPQLKQLTSCIKREMGGIDGWFSMATLLHRMGKLDKALEVYTTLLQTTFNGSSDQHNMLRQVTSGSISDVYRSLGNYSDAWKHSEQILKDCENTLPPDHPVLARSYDSIASIYLSKGDYSKALSHYEKALEIWQKILPSDHPNLSVAYGHIALVHHSMGNYLKAISFNEKVREVQQKHLPDNHPDNAATNHNFGIIYYSKGDYGTALSYVQQALNIMEKTLPPDHLDLAVVYTTMCSVHLSMGNLSMALGHAEKALEVQKSGPLNHPNLVLAYSSIASVHAMAGNYTVALSFFERAIDIHQKTLPSNHPILASMYINVGGLHQLANNYATASSFYEKAVHILGKTLPPDHLDWVVHYTNTGYLHHALGDHKTALQDLEKAFAIGQKSLLPDHPRMASTYYALGTVRESMGHYSVALSFYEKALDIYEKTVESNHPDLNTIHKKIAWLSMSTAGPVAALSHLKESFDTYQNYLEVNHIPPNVSSNDVKEFSNAVGSGSTAVSKIKESFETIQQMPSPNEVNETCIMRNNINAEKFIQDIQTAASDLEKLILTLKNSSLSNHPMFSGVVTNIDDRITAAEHLLNMTSAGKKMLEISLQSAQSYRSTGKFTHENPEQAEAIKNYQSTAYFHAEKFFEIIRTYLSPNDPFMAGVYNNIGVMLLSMNDYSTALTHFMKALEVLDQSFSNNYSILAMTYSNMAKVLEKLEEYNQAFDYANQAVTSACADWESDPNTIKNYEDHRDQLETKITKNND